MTKNFCSEFDKNMNEMLSFATQSQGALRRFNNLNTDLERTNKTKGNYWKCNQGYQYTLTPYLLVYQHFEHWAETNWEVGTCFMCWMYHWQKWINWWKTVTELILPWLYEYGEPKYRIRCNKRPGCLQNYSDWSNSDSPWLAKLTSF